MFPFESFRPDQMDAIKTILTKFNEGKRIVLMEMPVGGGKSVVAYTIAKFFNRSYYLTIQKILQDQLIRDFGKPDKSGAQMVDLKGRNNYPCSFNDRMAGIMARNHLIGRGVSESEAIKKAQEFIGTGKAQGFKIPSKISSMRRKKLYCDQGICKVRGESKCPECFPSGKDSHQTHCAYWNRLFEALDAKMCLMNFKSFLYQTSITHAFGPRELLICDEGHNIESELLSFIGFTLSDRPFKEYDLTFPKLSSAKEYGGYLEKNDIKGVIKTIIEHARLADDIKKEDEWTDILRRVTNFLNTAADDNWVALHKVHDNHSTIELKPIYVRQMAEDLIFGMANKILIMSATILSPKTMCDSLGIDPSETYSVRFNSRFPVENRPIYFMPVGSLSYKNKAQTLPKIIGVVDHIMDKYGNVRGIIHTHNMEIARLLTTRCKNRSRMLFQENWANKTDMLKHHGTTDNTVIVAPAMHEGLDLKDDLARFQIIVKVPYPSLKDNPQLEARMKASNDFYDWLTALKLVQSTGRAVRSETDWAHTYILDSDFGWFRNKVERMLPKWFTESVIHKDSL